MESRWDWEISPLATPHVFWRHVMQFKWSAVTFGAGHIVLSCLWLKSLGPFRMNICPRGSTTGTSSQWKPIRAVLSLLEHVIISYDHVLCGAHTRCAVPSQQEKIIGQKVKISQRLHRACRSDDLRRVPRLTSFDLGWPTGRLPLARVNHQIKNMFILFTNLLINHHE